MRKLKMITICLTTITVAAGCQRLSYTGPNGERLSRTSFASKTSISQLTVEVATNGIRRVEMKGYQNDSTQAIGAVTEAAVRAAVQAAMP
jgi:hypothetical protein